MSREGTIVAGQHFAEASMQDVVRVSYESGTVLQDESTGRELPVLVDRFTSKAKVLASRPVVDPAGGRVTVALETVLAVPIGAPLAQPGDVAEVVASGDPLLVGRRWRIIAASDASYATARRYRVESVVA